MQNLVFSFRLTWCENKTSKKQEMFDCDKNITVLELHILSTLPAVSLQQLSPSKKESKAISQGAFQTLKKDLSDAIITVTTWKLSYLSSLTLVLSGTHLVCTVTSLFYSDRSNEQGLLGHPVGIYHWLCHYSATQNGCQESLHFVPCIMVAFLSPMNKT